MSNVIDIRCILIEKAIHEIGYMYEDIEPHEEMEFCFSSLDMKTGKTFYDYLYGTNQRFKTGVLFFDELNQTTKASNDA